MEQIVDLGFIEECESWRLDSRFFSSKVGGKPSWLDLKNIPGCDIVKCKKCNEPCIFLCQIYAPYESDDNGFHRVIFIFVCKNNDCCQDNNNDNFVVLRSQLPRDNEFYSFDPPVERQDWQPDITADKWMKICHVCGLAAPSKCSKCKKINYCSRAHQIYDWKNGHKQSCNDTNTTTIDNKNSLLFPEYELVIESEKISDDDDNDDVKSELEKENKEIEIFNSMLESNNAGSLQNHQDVDADLLKMSANEEDENFVDFRAKINNQPDQVLRYNRGGTPLYISSKNKINDIPNCEECGDSRQFEFQIMPQLLNDLELNDVLNNLDWGILAIFTCKKSCVPKSGYAKEYLWKQDIVETKNDEQ